MTVIDKNQCSSECADCGAGKARHSSHPLSQKKRAENVGDIVYIDLSGIVHANKASHDGQTYYLLC